MQRILVTGSSGFVGTHLLPCLALHFPASHLIEARFDLCDHSAIAQAIRADPPDACVHLAAISAIQAAEAQPDAARQVNYFGTLALARALLEAAPGCLLLHVSTADAYGRSFRGGAAATEATQFDPMNTYAATKAEADLALGEMARLGLRVIRARPFNHIGPGQSAAFAVASYARQVARVEAGLQPPVLRVGALDPLRDFLDVRDVCRAYALCLARADDIPPGTALNIASSTSRRVGDVLADLVTLAGIDAEILTDADRLRPSDIPVARGDASAARTMLGWEPRIAWHRTLEDTLFDWRARVLVEGQGHAQ
jgi:GDP-4-dehydro-6-deoxy-D-mannose reductase